MARDIPQRFIFPVKFLGSIDGQTFDEFISRLSGDSYLENSEALEDAVRKSFPKLTEGDARQLSIYIATMSTWSIRTNMRPIDSIIDEMVTADNLDVDESVQKVAKDRILELVSNETLRTFALISSVYTQREKVLNEASVTIDVRPVFNETNKLLAVTFWHTLVLAYDAGGTNSQNLEVAAEKDDLIVLRDQINSSLEQLDILEKQMKASGIRVWTSTSEENR